MFFVNFKLYSITSISFLLKDEVKEGMDV